MHAVSVGHDFSSWSEPFIISTLLQQHFFSLLRHECLFQYDKTMFQVHLSVGVTRSKPIIMFTAAAHCEFVENLLFYTKLMRHPVSSTSYRYDVFYEIITQNNITASKKKRVALRRTRMWLPLRTSARCASSTKDELVFRGRP